MRKLALIAALCTTAASRGTAQAHLFTVERYFDLEQVASPMISPDGNHIVFSRSHVDVMNDRWTGMLWAMDADGGHQQQLVEGSGAQWSPDGTRIAYLAAASGKTQLWVRYMDGSNGVIQVTRGVESPIDFAWAPDGRSLAFTMDVADTSGWNIAMPAAPEGAHWTDAPRVITRLDYRADRTGYLGDTWRQLFVVDAEGGTPRQVTHGDIQVGARQVGIPQSSTIAWLPDGKTVVVDGNLVPGADLAYRVSNLYAVDVASGTWRRLTPDSGYWHTPVVSPDGKWIAYTGFAASDQIYHASDLWVVRPDGTDARALTTGFDRDPESIAWADNSTLWFSAADHGTVNTWTTSVDAKVPTVKPASNGTQVLLLGSLSTKNGVGVAVRTAPQAPAELVRFGVKKGWDLQQLTHVNDGMLSGLKLGDVEEVDATSSGDTKVQGWLVKPPTFDPAKKYPLILEIHGGPSEMSNVGFNPSFQNFAANGFLVLFVNPRGSTGYGTAFGDAINQAYPGVDYDDLMASVDEVISHGSVDTTRMYVGGCSGGGILSAWVIGHTHRFAAATVRCPVTDWISMLGETDVPLYTEHFFAKPFWEDPAAWLKTSPLMFAGNITTPTLIMTGDLDMRTPSPQSEELYTALKLRGVRTTLLRFAGEFHGTTSKPSNWVRTQRYMMSWYDKYRK